MASQHVRAHFIRVGESSLELLEATAPESAIARYVDKRGPGIHHITLRVDDITRGARAAQGAGRAARRRGAAARRRRGAGGVHPSLGDARRPRRAEAGCLADARAKDLGARMQAQIGIIGGSGLYDMAELTDRSQHDDLTRRLATPSGPYTLATLRGKRVAFLARHGDGHRLIAVGAELPRQYLRLQDARCRSHHLGERGRAAFARNCGRSIWSFPISSSIARSIAVATFFGNGIVAHVGFAHPFCEPLRLLTAGAADGVGRTRAPRRNLRLHGRAAVLDARRIEPLSVVGRRTSSA